MSNKAAHTPTPWEIIQMMDEVYICPGPDHEFNICHMTGKGGGKHWSNAELIIIAVNHHQELVTRLYNLVNALDLMGSPDYNTASIFETIELRKTEARETLKKVIQ